MATTNPARSPKRIRRWLQTTAVGTVLASSSLFGLIAVQGANAAHDASAAPAATPWSWPSERSEAAVAPGSVVTATMATPTATGTLVNANPPAATGTVVATVTPQATSTPQATPAPTVRARTRAS